MLKTIEENEVEEIKKGKIIQAKQKMGHSAAPKSSTNKQTRKQANTSKEPQMINTQEGSHKSRGKNGWVMSRCAMQTGYTLSGHGTRKYTNIQTDQHKHRPQPQMTDKQTTTKVCLRDY